MEEQINYYTELELDRNLSSEELGKQLKAIIRKWRNRTTAPDQEVRHRAEKVMEMAEEAIGILTDPTKKATYDSELTEQKRKKIEIKEQNEPELTPRVDAQAEYNRILENANHFIKIGDSNETMNLARQLIDMNPDDWRGWEITGRVYHDNDRQLAKNYYQKAIELEKNIPAYVYYNLGVVQNVLGKQFEAFVSFQRSLDITPSYDLPLKKCNELLEYVDIDSVIPFFEKLNEKRNDPLSYETLAKAYSMKADTLVQEINGDPTFISKEQIHKYIELMEKAKSYSEKPEINQKIAKAKYALGKEFDKSKIPVLIFPLLVALGPLSYGEWSMSTTLSFLLSVIALAVIVYSSIRTRFEINRWKMEGKGDLYDKAVDKTYIKGSLKWTIGIWFLLNTFLSPITTLLYLVLTVYLIFTKILPQLMPEKALESVNNGTKGNQ